MMAGHVCSQQQMNKNLMRRLDYLEGRTRAVWGPRAHRTGSWSSGESVPSSSSSGSYFPAPEVQPEDGPVAGLSVVSGEGNKADPWVLEEIEDEEGNGSLQETVTNIGVQVEDMRPVDVQALENPPPLYVAQLTPIEDQE